MQSKRRQAEQAVVAAAREWALNANGLTTRQSAILYDAVDALEALDLADIANDSAGAYGRNSPETSVFAAESVRMRTSSTRQAIVNALIAARGTDLIGLTCSEMERRIRKAHTTTSSQVNYLMNGGWIEDSGFRRDTPSGRPAIVWKLTEQAFQHLIRSSP